MKRAGGQVLLVVVNHDRYRYVPSAPLRVQAVGSLERENEADGCRTFRGFRTGIESQEGTESSSASLVVRPSGGEILTSTSKTRDGVREQR